MTPQTTPPTLRRPAGGALGIHPLLADRWSTRAFDPGAVLGADVLARLLEAARWSPSASNTQPWRFAVAERGTPGHTALVQTLIASNQLWAPDASVLVLVASARRDEQGQERPWADLDTGQALAHLSVQAAAEGLLTHAMGGFDREAVRQLHHLPAGVEPLAVLALGRAGDAARLPERLRERESAPRVRRPLEELLLASERAA